MMNDSELTQTELHRHTNDFASSHDESNLVDRDEDPNDKNSGFRYNTGN